MRLLAFAVVCLFAVAAFAADFTVHPDQVISEDFVGFGAQFNGWLYCKPNWGEGGVNETNVKDLEAKMIELGPQHVRIFVEIQPDSRQGAEPQVKQSVIRTIELAQRCGASVNCTLWHGPYPDTDAAGKMMADMMADFIRNHHLAAVKYVTLQNEPNGFNMDMKRYNALYRAFDKALRENGLRDQIKIVGGDLLQDHQAEWFRNLGENLADVCDGYSVHMYRDIWELDPILKRVGEIRAIADQLPKDRQRPLHLTEFGFRGHRKGKEEPGRDDDGRIVTETPLYGLLCGWRLIDCLDHGFVSMLHWDAYDAWYDRFPMHYGFVGEAKDGWPKRPHYELFRMFTHAAKPGWKTVLVEGTREGGQGGREGVIVAAMRGPSGEWAVFAANRMKTAQTISIAGAPVTMTLVVWNGAGDGKARAAGPGGASPAELTLPPMSVVALTAEH